MNWGAWLPVIALPVFCFGLWDAYRNDRSDVKGWGRVLRTTQPKVFWFGVSMDAACLVGCLVVIHAEIVAGKLP